MSPQDPILASVLVDLPARALSEPFDYAVPDSLRRRVAVGTPALVPFGPRRVVGYVVGLSPDPGERELKELLDVLGEPLFGLHAYGLARWIAEEYVSSLSEAMRLFMPPGGAPAGPGGRPRAGAVDDRWVRLTDTADMSVLAPSATMQRAVVDAISTGPVRVAELRAQLGSVHAALKALEAKGLVRVELRRRVRGGPVTVSRAASRPPLNVQQEEALRTIVSSAPGSVVVVDGVTGSGKTEVYMRAIEEAAARGGRALVLVPEISLTPQTVGRFRSRFGDRVAVLHSRLSLGERYDQWDLARSGDVDVVVGARSALFAPLPDLALVVVDEEHEASYKQGSAPRYHVRTVAERLCGERGAVLVLASATPSIETRQACDDGRYRRTRLTERATGAPMPEVAVVDMASEFADGHRKMFSRPLLQALREVVQSGDKAVLLLNRRGFASFLLCRECGFVPGCPYCSVSLTLHLPSSFLTCHHCAHTEPVPAGCPSCGSVYLRQFGAGTQRVEAELASEFPGLPVVRMDADTTRGKGGHERQLAAFEALSSGVLLGTQMIAKGLDYHEVTLVGVVNADTVLHLPDLRAAERTYQLLEQVSGRAGRGDRPGRVIVQTYWPDHPAIVAAARHDPEPLLAEESRTRRALGYPPFGRLANVLLLGKDEGAVRETAAEAADLLREIAAPEGVQVLGPAPAPLARLRGTHRWHVLLKGPATAPLPAMVRKALLRLRPPGGVSVAPDIDPMDLL